MSVWDVIYQEDTKEVTDEFSEEIRQFRQEITSWSGQNNLWNRYFFHSDDVHLYTSLQDMLKEQKYLQQKDLMPLQEKLDTSLSVVSSDIHSLRTDILSHTQQLEQISATLQEFTKEWPVDKKIHDSIYHELKTFSVQLKHTVDSYIDKKVQQAVPEKKASHMEETALLKLQEAIISLQQSKEGASAWFTQEQKLHTDLLRQKMNYMFAIAFLSFIIVLLVGYFLLAFL